MEYTNDELKIYRGKDFVVNDNIIIHQPTLDEIVDFGEQEYWNTVYTFTATPTDMKYHLSLIGVDWNEIDDWEGFRYFYKIFTPDMTGLIFRDIDFSKYEQMRNVSNDEIVLYDIETDSIIDRSIYKIITDYLRKSHCIKYNVEHARNNATKRVLIEDAKDEYERNKDKPFTSSLKPLISTMCCMEGFKYNQNTVWDMKINAFMDAVQSILHIKNADLLLQSGYSGFGIDLKKINKKQLNYFRNA